VAARSHTLLAAVAGPVHWIPVEQLAVMAAEVPVVPCLTVMVLRQPAMDQEAEEPHQLPDPVTPVEKVVPVSSLSGTYLMMARYRAEQHRNDSLW
jgi:hypothetical protein